MYGDKLHSDEKYLPTFRRALTQVVKHDYKRFFRSLLIWVPLLEFWWIVPDSVAVPLIIPVLIVIGVVTWRIRVRDANKQHEQALRSMGRVSPQQLRRTDSLQFQWEWTGWTAGIGIGCFLWHVVADSFPWVLQGLILTLLAIPFAQLGKWLVQAHRLAWDVSRAAH